MKNIPIYIIMIISPMISYKFWDIVDDLMNDRNFYPFMDISIVLTSIVIIYICITFLKKNK